MLTILGLRARLMLAISLLIALVAGFFAFYFPNKQQEAANNALETRAVAVSNILAKLVAPAVEFEDRKSGEMELANVKDQPGLLYVVVLTQDGNTFLRYRHAGVGPGAELVGLVTQEQVVERDSTLHVSIPVRGKDSGLLGTMIAGFSRESIMQARQESVRTALMVSGGIFLVGLAVAWLLSVGIAKPLLDASRRLLVLSQELVAAARGQESAGAEHAAAIEETRRTMELVLGSAQDIAQSSSMVLGNAERTVQGNRDVAQRIRELNTHAEKVAEVLATIMQVADRTDLLALNAALEGTKAGEAGRGFALVAAEMRRLAESVMESVAVIRKLMNDVRSASQSAVQAGHEGIALSEQTTRSAGDIALVTQKQRQATEEVGRSMDEMAGAVANTMANTRQTVRTAAVLAELASAINGLIGRSAPDRQGRGNGVRGFTATYPTVSGQLPMMPRQPPTEAPDHDPNRPRDSGA
jgi:methyl-accepting chemotaxis protein